MSLLPIDSLVPADLRASIRTHVSAIPNHMAAAQADEIADLTVLAVTDAIQSIDRVACRATSYGASMAVMSAAASTTKAVLERLEEALVAYAKESGAVVYSASVQMGGGGQVSALLHRLFAPRRADRALIAGVAR